jgi:uncharacterized protein with NRDE domain
MCLIAFAIGADARCPLLIAANRDEFFDRPTEPLHRWLLPDGSAVLGGRDLREGGTWLGVSESGRVAMLTNVRSGNTGAAQRSRGELPTRWLQRDTDWDTLLAGIAPQDHGGFNLVVGDFQQGLWGWVSNRDPSQPHSDTGQHLYSQRLAPGVYGLSNATLDTPWSKTQRLKTALHAALNAHDQAPDNASRNSPDTRSRQDMLCAALADPQREPPARLPATGVSPDVEHALSSPFVDMGQRGYGTRSSLILSTSPLGADRWRVSLREWTHGSGSVSGHRWSNASQRTAELDWGPVSPR